MKITTTISAAPTTNTTTTNTSLVFNPSKLKKKISFVLKKNTVYRSFNFTNCIEITKIYNISLLSK
jgi:hypothetical protein